MSTQSRWIGQFPKIGIRPTIDGRRRGVRESLDAQVMTMAQTASQFLTANLRYPDGTPVECVIADSCIGGVAEAAACADKFAREGVGVSLTVTPCWCYGSETMDMDPRMPKAVWGFNGTERPGAVYLAAVLAGHNQKGLPAFGIYGRDVQDRGDTTIPADVHAVLNKRTNQTWPTTWFAPNLTGSGPFADVYGVMNNWSANHGSISYGHVGADMIALASVLRIPVAMHNVPESQVFRPSAWGLFGAQDPQGSDYRACANFGPMYG